MLRRLVRIGGWMARLILTCLLVGGGGPGPTARSAAAAPPAQTGNYTEVVTIRGAVYACATTTNCETQATKGMRVYDHGEIRTGPGGSVDLQSPNTVFRMESQATLQIQETTNAFSRLILKAGRLFVSHDPKGREIITVQAGSKRVEAAGTQFSVVLTDVVSSPDDIVGVTIPKGGGTVTMTLPSGKTDELYAGHEITLPADVAEFPDDEVIDDEDQADWSEVGAEWEADEDLDLPDLPEKVSETGYTIGSTFVPFWQEHGSVGLLGYPINEAFFGPSVTDPTNDTEAQCFERALLEYHPEYAGSPFDVLIALLGVYTYDERYGAAGAPGQVANQTPGASEFFPQTGHWLGGRFRDFWQTRGGLIQFGYPISDEFEEGGLLDPASIHTVQYFERAVFEYNPDLAGTPFEVSLAPIGSYYCYGAPEPPPDAEEPGDETPTEEPDDDPTPTEEPTP